LKLDPASRSGNRHNTHAAEIEADSDSGKRFQASGTPIFLHQWPRCGGRSAGGFVTAVDAQLKVANALVRNAAAHACTTRSEARQGLRTHQEKSLPAPAPKIRRAAP